MSAPGTDVAGAPAGGATAAGVREVRSRLRRLRRRHHSKSLGDLLSDLYLFALLAALYGWAFVDMGRDFLGSTTVSAGDPAEQRWLVIAAVLTAAGFGWAGLRALGPVFVGPALQSWVASAPIDRRALLLPRFAGLLTGASAVVALLGFLFGVLSGIAAGGSGLGPGTVDGTLLGAAIGLLAGAGAVVAQGVRRARWAAELPGRVPIVAGALIAGAVVTLHFAGGTPMPRPAGSVPPAVPPLVFAAAGTAVVFAVRALRRLDRSTTTTGAQFASSAAAAAVMLDPTLVADLLEVRRWRALGRVRSGRFRGGPRWWVLTQAELRRAVRRRGALLGWAALVLVQYAVALAVPGLAGPAHLLTAFLAGDRLAGGLRAITRSPGLRRALGGGDTELKLAHLAVPALATVLFFLITLPVAGDRQLLVSAVLLLGVAGAVYRSGTRPALVYDGPIVETPFGLIPVDLLRQLWRGWDVVALLVVVDLIATR
ncbi:hypothetical protein J2S43_000604 [Catenuloplanes nepalensis]|uniref:ABC transporter permease n=1 Tax=Catenuloplanes nepalensis TaxID=587533 RepID=A0ABT9MKZ8_9ACTN|nr:DUF6297 family protein [Catenuloplanes nepalensis]MDP9792092.1 hypothetical protein [Catenuloplanes nepalensis]